MEIRTVKPGEIIVKDRSRKDLGDLSALATSIDEIGLLHPPVVTAGLVLVAGERRLEAVKLLGWQEVPVTVAATWSEVEKALYAERDENTCRKDLLPSEAVAIGARIEEIERPKAEARQAEHGGTAPGICVSAEEHRRCQRRSDGCDRRPWRATLPGG